MNSVTTCINPPLTGPWLQKHSVAVRSAACFLSVTLATACVSLFGTNQGDEQIIWLANGVLLAYLLLAPRWHWPVFLGAGFAAEAAGGVFVAGHFHPAILLLAALNISEVLAAALLIRRRSVMLPRFEEGKYLLRFIGIACVAAPLATGLIYALILALEGHSSSPTIFFNWAAAHGLGIAVTTPAFVTMLRLRKKNTIVWRKDWLIPALLVLVTIAAFCQSRFPLIVLVYPLLVIVPLRLRLGWSTLALLVVALISGLLTSRGMGPLAMLAYATSIKSSALLQFFIGRDLFIMYAVSAVVEQHKALERRIQAIASLHALVGQHSRDAIIMADLSGKRRYGSSAAQSIEAWKPEQLLTEEGIELVHPEDRPRVRSIMAELRSGADGAQVECRVRKPGGDYIWVEASLSMIHDPLTGVPSGILNFARDVSVRKFAEVALQEAYDAVEALSVTDPLTGLANRRRFDKCLSHEWRRGVRSGETLSLLMIDVDNFKKYNDTYGHPRGDNCLKQIAEAALDVAVRPADLVARFGGEEFVVVLPNTDNAGAMHVANRACEAIRRRALPHAGNPPGIVTISVGCASMMPMHGLKGSDLLDMADMAVYKAKQSGRNQAFNGCAASDPAAHLPAEGLAEDHSVGCNV